MYFQLQVSMHVSTYLGEKIFTFLQYGSDEMDLPQIYEIDYPLAVCGCFSEGCACQSCACTII